MCAWMLVFMLCLAWFTLCWWKSGVSIYPFPLYQVFLYLHFKKIWSLGFVISLFYFSLTFTSWFSSSFFFKIDTEIGIPMTSIHVRSYSLAMHPLWKQNHRWWIWWFITIGRMTLFRRASLRTKLQVSICYFLLHACTVYTHIHTHTHTRTHAHTHTDAHAHARTHTYTCYRPTCMLCICARLCASACMCSSIWEPINNWKTSTTSTHTHACTQTFIHTSPLRLLNFFFFYLFEFQHAAI